MCCFWTVLIFIGPRAAILVWWLIDPARWQLAFPGNFLLPLLGFLFLPWLTLAYVLVAPGGIAGFDWIWLGLGLLIDLGQWSGSGYRHRDRFGYRR
ncbi:MAG: hypothetical protein ACM30E_08345 [Nitrososphaerales archaeon]